MRLATMLSAAAALVLAVAVGSVPMAGAGTPGDPAELTFTGCDIGPGIVIIRWAVVNNSLPTSICDLHIQPAASGCPVVDARAPAGWSYFVNPDGSVDWYANTPADCIPTGGSKAGFGVRVDDGTQCCYDFQLTDATGAIVYSGVQCFSCNPVSVESGTWGRVKVLYR